MDQMLEQWLDQSIDQAIEKGMVWFEEKKPVTQDLGTLRETICKFLKIKERKNG